jgi:hypothetical protein
MEWNAMDVNVMERTWLDVAQNRKDFLVWGHSSPAHQIQEIKLKIIWMECLEFKYME